MKRYFTFATPPDPTKFAPRGMYHYLSLPGGGYVCVFDEESAAVPADWTQLSHLLDSTAANFNGVNVTPGAVAAAAGALTPAPSALAGITTADSMFQVAKKLATVHPLFHP